MRMMGVLDAFWTRCMECVSCIFVSEDWRNVDLATVARS